MIFITHYVTNYRQKAFPSNIQVEIEINNLIIKKPCHQNWSPMENVKSVSQVHFPSVADHLVEFECSNAFETEGIECDKTAVATSIRFIQENPHYGEYFVYLNPEDQTQVCASMFVVYENDTNWWIQSVYVAKQHRRKGIFSAFFNYLMERSKKCGVEKLQLCVLKGNKKAQNAYNKVGMLKNDVQFYGAYTILGDENCSLQIQAEASEHLRVQECESTVDTPLQTIVGEHSQGRKRLTCSTQVQVLAYCQYYEQFDSWRGGLVYNISYLSCKPGQAKQALDSFIRHLWSSCQCTFAGLRFMVSQEQLHKVQRLDQRMQLCDYDIMEINVE